MASLVEKVLAQRNTAAMPSYAYAESGPYAAYQIREKFSRRNTLLTGGRGVTSQPALQIKTLLGG